MRNLFSTLRARFLIAFIVASTVPLAVIGLILVNIAGRALNDQSMRELSGLASGASHELDTFINEMLVDGRAIASLPDMASMDPVRQQSAMESLFGHYHRYAQFGVADPVSGQLLVTVPPIKLVSIAHVQSYQSAAKGQQGWVIAPTLAGDKLILHIHTPITDTTGSVVGVFGSPVPLPNLAAILRERCIGEGNALLLDENGHAFVQAKEDPVDHDLDYTTLLGLAGSQLPATPGTATYTLNGVERIASFVPVPNYRWTVVVDRPVAEALAPAINARNLAIGGLGLSILLSVIAALLLSGNLTRPVRDLAVAVRALGEGNSNIALPVHKPADDEISTLVQAFARMRTAVSDREAAIRKQGSAMEAASDGMAILDPNLHFEYVNAAYATIHGYTDPQELIHQSFQIVHPTQEHAQLLNVVMARVGEQGAWHGELHGLRRDGTIFDQEASLTRIEGGEFVCVVRDITARKEAERAYQQSQRLESLGVLAGGIAHDFNNLLTAILGNASLARAKLPADAPAQRHVGLVVTSATRAADLTRQLLAYAGKGQFAVGALDLLQLIRENSELLTAAMPSSIEIVIDLPTHLPTITADKGQIQQVLMNLVLNAGEAAADVNGKVTIKCFVQTLIAGAYQPGDYIGGEALPTGDYVCLAVTDTGAGMTPATIERIFEPFYTTKAYGRGLGLAATLGIVRTHKGGIQVKSKLGHGTQFSVFFPANGTPQQSLSLTPSTTTAVIDDEKTIH